MEAIDVDRAEILRQIELAIMNFMEDLFVPGNNANCIKIRNIQKWYKFCFP